MPFTNGIFTRVRSWVADAAAGLSMQPNLMDQDANDIALGLSTTLLRDGTSTPTANLPMAGKILTGLGAGVNPGDSINFGQVSAMLSALSPDVSKIHVGYAATGNSGNVQVTFPTPFPTFFNGVFTQVNSSGPDAISLEVYNTSVGGFGVNALVAPAAGGPVQPGIAVGFWWVAFGS